MRRIASGRPGCSSLGFWLKCELACGPVYFEDRPKLRYGYFGTVVSLLWDNTAFRAAMAKELQRRALGPFRRARHCRIAAPRAPVVL